MSENRYNREKAVEYALRYALNPNPKYKYILVHGDGGGDCSNFISQCLNAGGAPMDFKSAYPWWYDDKGTFNTNDDTWSISWAVAHSLYWCLKVRYKYKLPGLKGKEVLKIDELKLGDIIQYEDYKGMIYHSAIITAFVYYKGTRIPLITQHTYNAKDIPYKKDKAKRMHFMKIIVD